MTKITSKKATKHQCDKIFCTHCCKIKTKEHECFMKICKIPKNPKLPTLYFFDFETRVDENGYMVPFYCVIQKVCSKCDEIGFIKNKEGFTPHTDNIHCDTSVKCVPCCGYRQYVFEKNNGDIVQDLVDFMFEQSEDSTWIAHNGGRFDTVFLLRELLVKRKIIPKVIMNGNKIMCLEIETHKLRIIDSFLFLSMRLSKFPEALGIQDLTKGYHPYHFTNLDYVGPMVGLEYFDPPPEGTKERDKFDSWYNVQKTKTYVFREAIYYYCRLDVDILRQGCIIFARLIKEITGIFPFYDHTCHTVAGLALKIYRSNFLKADVIGQIPPTGYGADVNQSAIALCWLRDIELQLESEDKHLSSKLSGEGEQSILGRYGFCTENATIYQFHGCFYHGCEKCYESDSYNKVNKEKFYTLREKTRRTTLLFRSNGFKVIEKWECDYVQEKRYTYNMLNQLRHSDFFTHLTLNPRDALFGGRTSPAKLYHESLIEKTRYYDYTSLYPYVQKK
ncbi:DNA polymerase [Paramuricea clavata]|uniref:DNA-directed DNA polymerase n=1 Tax=Paramuricea clavata TaxID=317549 RepID=A0A6S7FVV0_PARCT|nr:DNA polymerase [Paramuricea clavata]